jgi:hypothetical protein
MRTSSAKAFPDDSAIRYDIAHGKYTRWAVDLTEDQVCAIIWLVGEAGCRPSTHPRSVAAQAALLDYRDKRFSLDEVREIIGSVMR